jgi:hypothetical protein
MTTKWIYTLFAACFLQAIAINSVYAKPKIKYGEWEISIAVKGLPIAVPVQTHRICLEKDHLVPSARQEHDCKMKWTLNGSTVNWKMKCSNGGNGKGTAIYNWDKMHGSSEINVPSGHMSMHSKLTGKWVAATCSAQSRH